MILYKPTRLYSLIRLFFQNTLHVENGFEYLTTALSDIKKITKSNKIQGAVGIREYLRISNKLKKKKRCLLHGFD